MSATYWTIGSSFALAVLVVLAVRWLWPAEIPSVPESGERGRRRKEALQAKGLVSRLEPGIRLIAEAVSTWPITGLRKHAEDLAYRAGRLLGFDGNDLIAASIVTGCGFAAMGAMLAYTASFGPYPGLIIGGLFGLVYPWFKFQDAANRRLITIGRGLPGVIDLISLSMESGLDFPGAIAQVSERLTADNPLRFELEHLLHKLALGRSRAEALGELSERAPVRAIRQFTSAVLQAEKRGTPLAEVLATQARVMRTQRSQAAEHAAARAAILLLGPMLLIFICVFIVILGPMVIRYLRGELF